MNKWVKETVWLAVAVSPALYIISGGTSQTSDINVHDTYYVIEASVLALVFGLPLLFAIYFARVLAGRFNNLIANFVFIASILLFVVFLSYAVEFLAILGPRSGWAIYPPVSAMPNGATIQQEPPGNGTQYIFMVQFVLLLLLAFTAIKTGQKIKKAA
ncbi:hypothetical protein [uncultured Flavobacterium sp.]|uniref:hypothetical protein n=1 Tax=uncultured Flavobacterium sp. TaxID=165435 RepID=UPI0025D55EF6|nr:hypothetical protein [uncultured Flavobacterium sp.]